MSHPRAAPRGFTLIELAISLAIFSFFMVAASMVLVQVNGSSLRVRGVTEAQQTARQALDTMADEIRMAGAGASSGLVGIAPVAGTCSTPSSCSTRRVPVIYSGPDVVVTSPGGETVTTNSIYVISMEPAAGTPSSEPRSMLGVVSQATAGNKPITIACADNAGVTVSCADATFGANTIVVQPNGTWAPLLVGDFSSAVYLRPTALSGAAGAEQLAFQEQLAGAFAPDPKAPFGFAPGASIGRARVVHYFLKKQLSGETQLMRSHPTLASSLAAGACQSTDVPFEDETTTPGGAPGILVGSGPVESLQIRYVVDSLRQDDPTKYTLQNAITSCDTNSAQVLREVRIQIVARSFGTDRDSAGGAQRTVYSTPGFEGATPSGGAPDAYPRRAFEARVVPRNLQGILRL